jgi:ABC-type transport system involved in cytochrome bd biosynthesis fused ATPase/permease subunit
MSLQNLFLKILSFAISALLLGLFIYFLPSILVIFGVIVLLLIIAGIALRFVIKKNMLKMNFIYTAQNSESADEEISEMKDVTNSSKNQSNKAPLT